MFVEVLDTAPQRTLLAIWYAYLDGQQRWMTATGPINGDTAVLQANITLGGNFPPNGPVTRGLAGIEAILDSVG